MPFKQNRGLELECVHALKDVFGFIEQIDEHGTNIFRGGLCKAYNHPFGKIVN